MVSVMLTQRDGLTSRLNEVQSLERYYMVSRRLLQLIGISQADEFERVSELLKCQIKPTLSGI